MKVNSINLSDTPNSGIPPFRHACQPLRTEEDYAYHKRGGVDEFRSIRDKFLTIFSGVILGVLGTIIYKHK